MGEIRIKIQPINVSMVCDDCGEGTMRPTGIQLMSNPAQYPHRCNQCGASKNYGRTYPYIEYEEVSND